ncbi:GGDEF domain-containing protein [Shewanella sp. VB17]|uniref:tetratricopeptide repeat-containing diguanylate cyclase n=1 Tax=Shewanella sp. VB17 TaxID=2739432 RepID=UPI001567AE6B|nr:GGDEF domain-containing protein [Shewanella sp. VB17]NRD73280.1 GGDEF domain-containing protein [Shewanella sp. VB17]
MVVKNGRLIGFYEFLNRMSKSTLTVKTFTCILMTYAVLFCGYVSAENVKLSELDQQLTLLESKRTQSLAFVADSLQEIKPLVNQMSAEQTYRYTLLQAHSYSMLGQSSEAISLLKQQITSSFSERLLYYKVRSVSLLANIYSYYNYFEDALKTLHLLLPLLNEINDIDTEVMGYGVVIDLFGQLNMPDESLKYAKIMYQNFNKIRSPRRKCFVAFKYAISIDGVYDLDVDKWLEVEALYQDAFDICKKNDEKIGMVGALTGRVNILLKRKEYDKAKKLTKYALGLASAIPYQYSISKSHLLLAQIAMGEGNAVLSIEEFNQSLDFALSLNDSKLFTEIYQPLAELHESLGNTDKALKYLKLYQIHYTKILGESQNHIIAFETTKLDYIEKERQIRYLNKDRELYSAKAELTESQRNNERMLFLFICGGLIVLTVFAISMTLQKGKYKKLVQFDVLTGVYNRGTGQNMAENQFVKGAANGADFSVLLFDLDYFKLINDQYGHGVGDWVLKKVCETVGKKCRSGDIFTRFGGDEFVIFMPNTSEEKASVMAEQFREQILAIDTRHSGHTFTVNASFGISSNTAEDLSLDPLLNRADMAMYSSKNLGRNRVSVYDSDMQGFKQQHT